MPLETYGYTEDNLKSPAEQKEIISKAQAAYEASKADPGNQKKRSFFKKMMLKVGKKTNDVMTDMMSKKPSSPGQPQSSFKDKFAQLAQQNQGILGGNSMGGFGMGDPFGNIMGNPMQPMPMRKGKIKRKVVYQQPYNPFNNI